MPVVKKVIRRVQEKKENLNEGALAPHVDTIDSLPMPEIDTKSAATSSKTYLAIIFAVLLILAIASLPAYYFYTKYTQDAGTASENDIKTLLRDVESVMMLPTGEVPTIAVVSDKTKLSGQVFFANAQNDDKVLIYPKARKAILYRPSTRKIIEVGPVNISATEAPKEVAGASASAQVKPYTLALYNGTKVSGLTASAEAKLKGTAGEFTTTSRTNAKGNYTETIVIPTTGEQKATAELVAKLVNGKVSTLPDGETAPKADILIILGTDFVK